MAEKPVVGSVYRYVDEFHEYKRDPDELCEDWSDANELDPDPGTLVGVVEVLEDEDVRVVAPGPLYGGRVMMILDWAGLKPVSHLEQMAAGSEIPWP